MKEFFIIDLFYSTVVWRIDCMNVFQCRMSFKYCSLLSMKHKWNHKGTHSIVPYLYIDDIFFSKNILQELLICEKIFNMQVL